MGLCRKQNVKKIILSIQIIFFDPQFFVSHTNNQEELVLDIIINGIYKANLE